MSTQMPGTIDGFELVAVSSDGANGMYRKDKKTYRLSNDGKKLHEAADMTANGYPRCPTGKWKWFVNDKKQGERRERAADGAPAVPVRKVRVTKRALKDWENPQLMQAAADNIRPTGPRHTNGKVHPVGQCLDNCGIDLNTVDHWHCIMVNGFPRDICCPCMNRRGKTCRDKVKAAKE